MRYWNGCPANRLPFPAAAVAEEETASNKRKGVCYEHSGLSEPSVRKQRGELHWLDLNWAGSSPTVYRAIGDNNICGRKEEDKKKGLGPSIENSGR